MIEEAKEARRWVALQVIAIGWFLWCQQWVSAMSSKIRADGTILVLYMWWNRHHPIDKFGPWNCAAR